MRTIIDLPEDQRRVIQERSERECISRAEALRRIIAEWQAQQVNAEKREERSAAIRASAGLWKHRGIDTDTYLAEIRSEWND